MKDMQLEVTAAINLIAANLYNKLPRRRVDAFAEELEKGIFSKFQGHWYPDNPSQGAAFRCLNVSGEKTDPIIIYAAINSDLNVANPVIELLTSPNYLQTGLDIEEVSSYLPKDLTIWIDPGEVSFSVGEKGQVKLLYSERQSNGNIEDSVMNPVPMPLPNSAVLTSSSPSSTSSSLSSSSAPGSMTDFCGDTPNSIITSFGVLNISAGGGSSGRSGGANNVPTGGWTGNVNSSSLWPTSNINNPWGPFNSHKQAMSSPWNPPAASNFTAPSSTQSGVLPIGAAPLRTPATNKTMTAAMFAQTKFGSTKLKTQAKRSNRLSPTENFSRNFNSQQQYQNPPLSARSQPVMNTNPGLTDRMQLHLQQSLYDSTDRDPFRNTAVGAPIEKYGSATSTLPTISNLAGSTDRFSPCMLGSLTGVVPSTNADQDWVDLSDMSVHAAGSQLLAA